MKDIKFVLKDLLKDIKEGFDVTIKTRKGYVINLGPLGKQALVTCINSILKEIK